MEILYVVAECVHGTLVDVNDINFLLLDVNGLIFGSLLWKIELIEFK